MPRPSRNQDQLLIQAAKELLPEVGVSGMSLQQIARKAGVNLGMFHYHFRTKAEFVRRVLQSIHNELQRDLTVQISPDQNPLENLRAVLNALALRTRTHNKLIVSLLRDFLNQDELVSQFLIQVVRDRIELVAPLIKAGQKAGLIVPLPVPQILGFCMASVNVPIVFVESARRLGNPGLRLSSTLRTQIVSENGIQERVDLALKAIRCDVTSRPHNLPVTKLKRRRK